MHKPRAWCLEPLLGGKRRVRPGAPPTPRTTLPLPTFATVRCSAPSPCPPLRRPWAREGPCSWRQGLGLEDRPARLRAPVPLAAALPTRSRSPSHPPRGLPQPLTRGSQEGALRVAASSRPLSGNPRLRWEARPSHLVRSCEGGPGSPRRGLVRAVCQTAGRGGGAVTQSRKLAGTALQTSHGHGQDQPLASRSPKIPATRSPGAKDLSGSFVWTVVRAQDPGAAAVIT